MKPSLLLSVTLGIALLLAGTQVAGCGSSAAESGPSYSDVLRGLESAALANKPYGAGRRANALPGPQKVVLHSFCNFAWEMKVNREEWKISGRAFVVSRIVNDAEFATEKTHIREIKAAAERLEEIIPLTKLDEALIKRYVRACYEHRAIVATSDRNAIEALHEPDDQVRLVAA